MNTGSSLSFVIDLLVDKLAIYEGRYRIILRSISKQEALIGAYNQERIVIEYNKIIELREAIKILKDSIQC